MCAECMASECDQCGETIPLDEDHTDEDTGYRFCHRCMENAQSRKTDL
jgi:formylmethanofuran dehydrogenase subunit E